MSDRLGRRRHLRAQRCSATAVLLVLAVATIACARAAPPPSDPTPEPMACSEVDVVFARGTHQPPGFGRVGEPFLSAMISGAAPRSVSGYAVDYAADSQQNLGPGAADATRHIAGVAAACPATQFVLGGYSQGAMVLSAAIGVPVAAPGVTVLPPTLSPRVAAVVVFGNPLGARAQSIETTPTAFRAQSADYCNAGDAVCGNRGPRPGSHRDYPDNGTTDQAAAFALARLSP